MPMPPLPAAFEPLPAAAAPTIAGYAATAAAHPAIEAAQAAHRIRLLNHWRIPRASRVLEVGCGQGTCTAVLAEAVGPGGRVDAVDPGPADYGAPVTLGRAQAHLSAGPLGSRIAWHRADAADFLARRDAHETWHFAVLAHCVWYFASPEALAAVLSALRGRVATLLVAEYALAATESDALPHVMASVARAVLEAHRAASDANIRCLLSPAVIKNVAEASGWSLESESLVVPDEALADGSWETATVKSEDFLTEIDAHVHDSTLRATLRSSRDAVLEALGRSGGGGKVRTMDVWVARFK